MGGAGQRKRQRLRRRRFYRLQYAVAGSDHRRRRNCPTRTNLVTNAPTTPIGRVTWAGGASYSVFLSGAGSLDLTDYATLRARAGWILGDFLPYGFAGFAVGRASYSVTTLVSGQQSTQTPPFPCTDNQAGPGISFSYANSAGQSSALLYGLSVGVGLDWAMTQNIFLRSEFEFIQFAPLREHQCFHCRRPGRRRPQVLIRLSRYRTVAPLSRLTARPLSLVPAAGHPSPTRGAYLKG